MGNELQRVDVMFDIRECAALLGAAKQEPAALRLLDAHDAFAELIEAAGVALEYGADWQDAAVIGRLRAALANVGAQS